MRVGAPPPTAAIVQALLQAVLPHADEISVMDV